MPLGNWHPLPGTHRWAWNTLSWQAGDSVCPSVFFMPNARPGAGQEVSSSLTMTIRMTNTAQALREGALWNSLWDVRFPGVLKVSNTDGFALQVTPLRQPKALCSAYFLSSAAAYLRRKNRITSACLLAKERSIDRYALSLWNRLVLPSQRQRYDRKGGADRAGNMDQRRTSEIWKSGSQATRQTLGLQKASRKKESEAGFGLFEAILKSLPIPYHFLKS